MYTCTACSLKAVKGSEGVVALMPEVEGLCLYRRALTTIQTAGQADLDSLCAILGKLDVWRGVGRRRH